VQGPALVKLGGSLLTDKSREEHFRQATARRLLREVAGTGPVVLLHGAGSFGHPAALRHRIGRQRPSPAAVSEVLASVGRLHTEIVSLAQREGLNPLSVPMTGHSAKGSLLDLPAHRIRQALEAGFMPVMHGTLVLDDEKGWRVASADEILASLAASLQPRLIVWATDVEGVHAEDPKVDPDAMLLERVGPTTTPSLSESEVLDATGRMGGKLDHAVVAARHASTLILNGRVAGRLRSALRGESVPGTWVDPS
jgi:isopentenyl phosphate kinase